MNKKVLIVFFVLVAVFLLLPLVSNVLRSSSAPSKTSTLSAAGQKVPSKLNETNLVNTAWKIKTKEMPIEVTITLQPGGQAVATVPPLFSAIARQKLGTDTIRGTWSAQGDKVIAKVQVGNNEHTVSCDIIGDKLSYQGKELTRVY